MNIAASSGDASRSGGAAIAGRRVGQPRGSRPRLPSEWVENWTKHPAALAAGAGLAPNGKSARYGATSVGVPCNQPSEARNLSVAMTVSR
jgi:hypothetical protein